MSFYSVEELKAKNEKLEVELKREEKFSGEFNIIKHAISKNQRRIDALTVEVQAEKKEKEKPQKLTEEEKKAKRKRTEQLKKESRRGYKNLANKENK